MCGYIIYECEDCGHQEERAVRWGRAESPEDDDFEVVGGEVESCPECGSDELTEHTDAKIRDEGREDFHSDG